MFRVDTFDEIVKRFEDNITSKFPNQKFTAESNMYKVLYPIMMEIKRIDEKMASYIDKNNYKKAEGVDLDLLLGGENFPRKKESKAKGFWITENSVPGTSALAGDIKFSDNSGNTYVNTEPFTVNDEGIAIIPIEAEEYGTSSNAPAETINTIKTPIFGLITGTNKTPLEGGSFRETDIEYRKRWENTRNSNSVWNTDGIRSAILEVNGVKSCWVEENDTESEKTVGGKPMPSHSRRYYVDGGADNDVAKAIFEVTDRAMQETGDITVKVLDDQQEERDVIFSRPTKVNVYFKIILDGYMSSELAREVIKNYITESKIHQKLTTFEVVGLIKKSIDTSGVINLEVHFSRNNSDFFSSLQMDKFEKAILGGV